MSFRLHRNITPSGGRIPSTREYLNRAAADRASHPKRYTDKNLSHGAKIEQVASDESLPSPNGKKDSLDPEKSRTSTKYSNVSLTSGSALTNCPSSLRSCVLS